MNVLKFTPFSSAVDALFWQSFVSKKLDVLKLSSESQTIGGYYATGGVAKDKDDRVVHLQSRFHVPANGLEERIEGHLEGMLINTNTIEEFRTMDKNQLFQQLTEKIVHSVEKGEALKDPAQLCRFLLLTFADLKKYKFYYWFAFPALMPQPDPWSIVEMKPMDPLTKEMHDSIAALNSPYFLVKEGRVIPLCEYQSNDNYLFGFIDPSTLQDTPGWPLRNYLYLIRTKWKLSKVTVLCYRQQNTSYLLETQLPETSSYDTLKSVGWERNVQGKLGPRMADLGPLMDPARLADTSIDLNLKLMKWRLMPDLDLEKIKGQKCLLLGAGTLGCYVARCLMGWGVRHITFVDNGKVSFSNPVRQPLYLFQDALEGGAPKAEAAAKRLKEIQPTITSEGISLSIPMPGHQGISDEKLKQDTESLSNLISSSDVVFLLTDSRESRWLPTLLATKHNKMVINSALGFDTYLVMRHGSRQNDLGCYFCNDIVAPTDSLTDRTLDQQCTVTRPGLAAIAAALAVELMVSLLQHPEGINAKADTSSSSEGGSTMLGLLPHQIRGFLGQFSNLLIVGQAYDKCTACSSQIVRAFDEDPLAFMKRVLEDPVYLERVTGLEELKKQSEALMEEWDVEEQDDF